VTPQPPDAGRLSESEFAYAETQLDKKHAIAAITPLIRIVVPYCHPASRRW
jgi:hypothetical protein